MRQEADGPSSPARVKQLEVHPLLIKTPKMRTARRLTEEAGPCPDLILLIHEVRLPRTTHAQKAPYKPRGLQCQGMLYLNAFAVGS